jgi:hypothetical protein
LAKRQEHLDIEDTIEAARPAPSRHLLENCGDRFNLDTPIEAFGRQFYRIEASLDCQLDFVARCVALRRLKNTEFGRHRS